MQGGLRHISTCCRHHLSAGKHPQDVVQHAGQLCSRHLRDSTSLYAATPHTHQLRQLHTDRQHPQTLVICNHNLLGFHGNRHDARLSPCTKCSIGGAVTSQRTFAAFAHSQRDGQTVEPSEYDSVGVTSTLNLSRYRSLLSYGPHDANWVVIRGFHSSSSLSEEAKSKLEETVKALKQEQKGKEEQKAVEAEVVGPGVEPVTRPAPPEPAVPPAALKQEAVIAKPDPTLSPDPAPTSTVVVKKPLRQRIVDELKHYYHGFRLLFIDVRVCIRLLWQVMNGKGLTRRERRQLVRTTADMFRLVPFSVFIIVPFMEFLLPVALKLFPGMLPSTFSVKQKEQEKIRKKLKVKLEMAKFLQDTIEEMAVEKKEGGSTKAADFVVFMEKIRSSGEQTSNEEILKYSKLFQDELTLDNLQHDMLIALCRLLELQPIGTSHFLRFQLRMKLRQLEYDDRMIQKEGLESLTVWEMQEACRARGMRAHGCTESRLRLQLQQWLDLHLNMEVPASLLILSRALYLPESLSASDQLKATISVLPERSAEEAKVKISEVSGERVDNKTKLELIKQEEKAIQKEKEEKAKAEAAKKLQEEAAKKKVEEVAKAEVTEGDVEKVEAVTEATPPASPAAPPTPTPAEAAAPTPAPEQVATPQPPKAEAVKPADVPIEEVLIDKAVPIETKPEEVLVDQAKVDVDVKPEVKAEPEVAKDDEPYSAKELDAIEEVLEKVAEERMNLKIEQENLKSLKDDVSEYQENLGELKSVIVASGGSDKDLAESKGAKRLSKKVNSIINSLEDVINNMHLEKDALMEDIEVKEVKIRRNAKLQEDADQRQEILDVISEKKRNLIDINELLLSMKRLQKTPDETRLQRIIQVLDEDEDGKIDIDDALKVLNLLGQENVDVSAKQMAKIIDLVQRENELREQEMTQKLEAMAGDDSAVEMHSGKDSVEKTGEEEKTSAKNSSQS